MNEVKAIYVFPRRRSGKRIGNCRKSNKGSAGVDGQTIEDI